MQKILVTGSNGLLGQKLVYKLKANPKFSLIATARGENRLVDKSGYIYESLDITNLQNVKDIFSKYKPDVIINSAAMTNVDACETDKEGAWLMNATAVQYQVDVLESLQNENYKPHFIHLSTDFIFDGTRGPLTEEEKPNPSPIYPLCTMLPDWRASRRAPFRACSTKLLPRFPSAKKPNRKF